MAKQAKMRKQFNLSLPDGMLEKLEKIGNAQRIPVKPTQVAVIALEEWLELYEKGKTRRAGEGEAK